jgi:hypothetical protein
VTIGGVKFGEMRSKRCHSDCVVGDDSMSQVICVSVRFDRLSESLS